MGHFVFLQSKMRARTNEVVGDAGVENGRSARARLGFRGFGSEGEVESRPVHRATRRDARYDEAPSSRPVDRPDRARAIDRRRSREGEGSRTQKRGRRRFSRVRRTRGLRVTHPRLCSCPCRSRRRRPCWTRQLPSRPSSPPWSSPRRPSRASRPSARSPRKEGFDSFADCAAGARERRRRRGRVRSRTGSRRRAGEYRGASTERGDVHERAPNAVARANGCAFGRRRHSFFTRSVSGNGTFHSESFVAMSSGRSVPENGKYTQVSSQRFLHVRTLPAVFSRAMAQSARPKINAFENRSSRPGRLQRPLL